jgi:DNA-binding response OmpR family regulator
MTGAELCIDGRPILRDKRILIVEDEAVIAMLTEDRLLAAGATVAGPVATVEDALRLIETAGTDGGLSAAVLDINLGGERVSPVADRLAALGVPFLFATGYGEGCDTAEGHAGAPVLRKPFGLEALATAVGVLTSGGRRGGAERVPPFRAGTGRRSGRRP